MAQHVLGDALLELVHEIRPLRPRAHQRHVAAQHVPQLREFVDVGPAEQPADRRAARVVVARPDRAGLALRVLVHGAELVNRERLAVQSHPLLPVEDRTGRRAADQERDQSEWNRQAQQGRRRQHDVQRALDKRVEALQRHVVDVDDRDAVQILQARAQRDHLQQIGHDLDVNHLAPDDVEQLQHPDVLFGGECDVEVVHPFAQRDVAGLVERAKNRQPAMSQVVAASAVIHEADDVVAQLPVLQDLVGHQASEFSGARNQDALEADARTPPPLERLADQFARGKRQQDVEAEEDAPDQLRHFVRATVLQLVGHVVRLEVQRGHDAEDHRQDAADEDGEEVVHPRAAAPQAIEPLHVEGKWHQHADKGQDVDVLAERGIPLRDRDEAAVKAQHVGQHERRHAEQRI